MSGARLATAITLMACAASVSIVVAAVPDTVSDTAPGTSIEWNLRASLDGKPIGQHRFSVSKEGDDREVESEASFAVKFMGITAYRYHHVATEHWRGNCLESLTSSTNDDGKPMSVRTAADGDALDVTTPSGKQSLRGCVMSFAYWNPAIQSQSHLLNAQTGQYEQVQVERIGNGSIDVRGQPVQATQFRIKGPANPIDVWYSAKGDWLGLDSTVAGGRKLSYRLQ